MTQRYCTHAPSTKPGERRKRLTHYQALVLSHTYEVQQCGHCGSWHFVHGARLKPKPTTTPTTQPDVPRPTPSAEAQAYGAQVLAALRASFNTQEVQP